MKNGRRKGTCAYCGADSFLTRDHVVPQCIFPFGTPSGVPVVPACEGCNGEKSKMDVLLRDMLTLDSDTQDTLQKHWLLSGALPGEPVPSKAGPVTRAIARNRSELVRAIPFEPARVVPRAGQEAEVHFRPVSVDLSAPIVWITRGLYSRATKGKVLKVNSATVIRGPLEAMKAEFKKLEHGELYRCSVPHQYWSSGKFSFPDPSIAVFGHLFWDSLGVICFINFDRVDDFFNGVELSERHLFTQRFGSVYNGAHSSQDPQ